MPPNHPLEAQFAKTWPAEAWQDVSVLIAVSGGADSVALAVLLWRLKSQRLGAGRLWLGHFNHRLRAEASDNDEDQVRNLSRQLQLPLRVGHRDRMSFYRKGDGLEASARRARYAFLRQEAESCGARYVVTAHTADDQAETVLHRIVRGTGLAGLAGIRRARPLGPAVTIVRPLLTFRRQMLKTYLHHLRIAYSTDTSNDDMRFTRNRIRHDLLPRLRHDYNPLVDDALLRLARLASEVQSITDDLVQAVARRARRIEPDGSVALNRNALAGEPIYLIRELLKATWAAQGWPCQAMGYRQWDRVARAVDGPPGGMPAQIMPGEIVVRVTSSQILLRPSNATTKKVPARSDG